MTAGVQKQRLYNESLMTKVNLKFESLHRWFVGGILGKKMKIDCQYITV